MAQDEEGCFYLAVKDSSGGEQSRGRILKYTYSKDTPAVPDTALNVYSLTDNAFIRQTAAIFQKKISGYLPESGNWLVRRGCCDKYGCSENPEYGNYGG